MKKFILLLLLTLSIASFGQITKQSPTKKYREYSAHADKPLLIYLSGSGERGNDPAVIDKVSFVVNFAMKHLNEYTILAPQQTANYSGWQGDPSPSKHDGVEFVEWAMANYPNDGRIYITGHSMGGHGTWDVVTALGNKITAFVVSAGRSDNYNGVKLMAKLHVPGRHYHGMLDTSDNSWDRGQQVCRWYAPENGDILFPYPNYGHGDKCYKEPDLNDFFLSKGTPSVPAPPPVKTVFKVLDWQYDTVQKRFFATLEDGTVIPL